MLNNPIQQIERTQDAYAGNPEGLQQRANMSKELIDLLAMQALQSDLAAQKRNMAMQQQGNPQTVRDQIEEGLMGEYRKEAAKDLGVGPSEGDVVERTGIAGQQMAQNAQVPQGAPQGVPQGGGGVASQTGPVKLAGGGIVAFDAGGEVRLAEYLTEKGIARDEFEAMSPQQQKQIQKIADIGSGIGGFLEGLGGFFDRTGSAATGVPSDTPPSTTPSAVVSRDNATKLDIPFDVNAGLALPPSMMPRQPNQPGVGVLRDGSLEDLAKPPAPPAPTSATGDPYLDALLKRTAEPRPAYEPPERSAELTGILSKLESTQRDPDAEARRIRDLYREEESRGINTSRLQELRSKYDKQEEQLSDPFNRFIGIASRQGKEGIAAAGQEYLAQDAGIRGLEDKYQGERDVIRQEQVTLNNTLGEKAVAAYNKTLDRNSQNDRQLATAFSALNEREQENARNAFEDAVKGDDKLDGLLIKLSDVRRRAIEDTTMTAGEAATASGQLTSSIESMQGQLQSYQSSYLEKAIPLKLYTKYVNNPLGLDDDDREKIAKAQSDALLDPKYVEQVAKLKRAIAAAEETRSALINKAGGEDVPSDDAAANDIKAALGII